MPEFSHCFSGLAAKSKLTHSELVRSIRFMIAAEFEAIQLYEQLAESTDNKLAQKVLMDITQEEKEHVGEFRHLLSLIAPDDEQDYAEGEEEAEEYLKPLLNGSCGCGSDCHCNHSESDSCDCKKENDHPLE